MHFSGSQVIFLYLDVDVIMMRLLDADLLCDVIHPEGEMSFSFGIRLSFVQPFAA